MDSTRQNKMARLIQRELSEMFRKDAKKAGGILISVTACRLSPDLGYVKVYLSVFPSERAQEVLKGLQANSKRIRHDLGNTLRYQLRTIPELQFYIDDSLDYANSIDELLKDL